MKTAKLLVSLCALTCAARAQTSGGPVLGWALDSGGRALHTIFGVPGASRLGPARRLPEGLLRPVLNPASNLVAALTGDGGAPVLFDLETASTTPLDGARPGPDGLVWSPSGTALALTYRAAQWVQIFAAISGRWQSSGEYSAAADEAAVSDDGAAFLALSGGALSLYGPAGFGFVVRGPISGFTFLAGARTPAWWSAGSLTIGDTILPLAKDDGETIFLASPWRGALWVVRSGSGVATLRNAAGETILDASCECSVTGLEPLGRAGVVRLATSGDGPLWVAAADTPRLFFVPRPPRAGHKIR